MNSDKINAAIIIEVLGRPPEHLTATLKDIIKHIEEEKGVVVKGKKLNDPAPMKDQPEFYTTFAEIEVEVDEILYLTMLIFKYMPAHIEIISPEEIKVSNQGLNEVLNELARRLHGYDEVARVIQNEKAILEKNLKELMKQKK